MKTKPTWRKKSQMSSINNRFLFILIVIVICKRFPNANQQHTATLYTNVLNIHFRAACHLAYKLHAADKCDGLLYASDREKHP